MNSSPSYLIGIITLLSCTGTQVLNVKDREIRKVSTHETTTNTEWIQSTWPPWSPSLNRTFAIWRRRWDWLLVGEGNFGFESRILYNLISPRTYPSSWLTLDYKVLWIQTHCRHSVLVSIPKWQITHVVFTWHHWPSVSVGQFSTST